VTLFIQCLVDSFYPNVGIAVVRLLERLGIPLHIPQNQTCCGQPAFNSGYRKEAVIAAKRFIEIFEPAQVIVCPSGSCVDMVKNHYPTLFEKGSPWHQRAKKLSTKIFELTQFLVDILEIEDTGASFAGTVTYHDSCHLSRNLGIDHQPRRLIAHVKGIELVEMKNPDKCCGFGGTFSVKYPKISTAILDEKIETILATGAQTVVGCDISCLMQIQGRLSRKKSSVKTMHIAELLAS
jgi:L-lactate dehydrogenase complex protein LldE